MLIGQERAASILLRALRQDRVSHAYLFAGPEGAGKTTAATLFAQALNCERRPDPFTAETQSHGDRFEEHSAEISMSLCLSGELSVPCGQCESCRRIEAVAQPDIHVMGPGGAGGEQI